MRARITCRGPHFEAEEVAARLRAAGDRGLMRAGEYVCMRSTALAPRRSGAMIASARVEAGRGGVAVRYGTNYAVIQHERADFHHPNGGRADFLRSAIMDPATARAAERFLAEELRSAL